nr:immunoglobulin light chain junction region [Macaca mulatta]
CQHYYSSPSRF